MQCMQIFNKLIVKFNQFDQNVKLIIICKNENHNWPDCYTVYNTVLAEISTQNQIIITTTTTKKEKKLSGIYTHICYWSNGTTYNVQAIKSYCEKKEIFFLLFYAKNNMKQ